MPKSKGRKPKKQHTKKAPARRPSSAPLRVRPVYDVGTLTGSDDAIKALLASDQTTPDQLIELLIPLLWLYHADGRPGNHCVDGCMTLHHAYQQFGITAEPKAVDLVVSNQRTGERTGYGRPDPYWSEHTFHGHCVLWLPASGRFLDPTVEQYPEVRRYRLGPVMGRVAASAGASPAQTAAMQRGELSEQVHFGVQREDLLLLYTTASEQYATVITDSKQVREATSGYRRTGINLASLALNLLRLPEVTDKARRAPYPRLHALLDAVDGAEMTEDDAGDIWFTMPVEGTEVSRRLDEFDVAPASSSPAARSASPAPRPELAAHDAQQLQAIMNDVETEARVVLSPTPAMGGGAEPAVVFELQRAIGMQEPGGPVREMQAETIISTGFTRFTPGAVPAALPRWSVRETETGLELWDHGGIWARAALDVSPVWRAAAAAQQTVRVLYGTCTGVRVPADRPSYSEADRDAELANSRQSGVVAAAQVPWIPRSA